MNVRGSGMNKIYKFIKLFKRIYFFTPLLCIAFAIFSVFHGILWGIQVVLQQNFFNSANQLFLHNIPVSEAVRSFLIYAFIVIFLQIINAINFYMREKMNVLHEGRLKSEIHKKISKLSSLVFEDPKTLDDINKAKVGMVNAVWIAGIAAFITFFYMPYYIFMGIYLFKLKPILSLSLTAVFLPTLITQIVNIKIFSKLEDASAPVRRKVSYFENCIIGRDYFKETRLLGGYFFFKNLYYDTLQILNNLRIKAKVKASLFGLGTKVLTLLGYGIILYMLSVALINREITPGAFAAVFSSIGTMFHMMNELICWHVATITTDIGSVNRFINFLEYPEMNKPDKPIPQKYNIKFNNVSFKYPNSNRYALENINMEIINGETIAVVGENGSGKSTLVKLLMGLYEPTHGSIMYGDTDISEINIKSVNANTSGVFQNYIKYQMILSDNIIISDYKKTASTKYLDAICNMVDINPYTSKFPKAYNTMLSREFEGVDLSGGQWQRIAIARAYYRGHNLIILDEPTSAIDPIEEANIYNQFMNISKGNTSVIVTHRLGSVRMADKIVVLSNSQIVEMGTHKELMSNNGIYRKMTKAQSNWYK
jgi:ATP-binding cassette subfamily B protein